VVNGSALRTRMLLANGHITCLRSHSLNAADLWFRTEGANEQQRDPAIINDGERERLECVCVCESSAH